jgi:hypothetical protein
VKPFFSYYGAKYTVAKYAGGPRRDLVIEPFAGSAAYSTRYAPRRVALYDLSPDVCDLWHFLIHCSEADIRAIPDAFNSFDEVARLPRGAGLLVRFWVSKGRAEPSAVLSPWYHKYRDSTDCKVWGPAVKTRIIAQKSSITDWTVDNLPYWKIPLREAHWHIDPPYNNAAGSRYPFSAVDYTALAGWCRALPGAVDVFENEGADWLPFQSLCRVETTRGKKSGVVSAEVIARFDNVIPLAVK